jgi:hypothetical protein
VAAMSDYLEAELLDHVLRGQNYPPPAGIWAGLFDADPTDAAAGGGTEIAGTTRQPVTFDPPVTGAGTCANTADLNWTGMPGGNVGAIGLFDAATGPNLLLHGALSATKTVTAGDTLTIYAGDLVITLD